MLSDEEKKAIEYWKTHMEILHWNTQLASEHYIKVLLDLIEKHSKEIEELKEEFKIQEHNYQVAMKEIEYKWKDKIKAKMKENEWSLENYNCDESDSKQSQAIGAWCVLQSLLEKE